MTAYDALLVLSFGGPEGPEEVMPFLGNVLRGRNVPTERMLAVGEHYQRFGGVSPINGQNRALIAALEADLAAHDLELPVYWGNRNWSPMLADTVAQMRDDGIGRAAVFVTSAFGSYSGCRQYREDLERARQAVGPDAPELDKLRLYYNHPGFIDAVADGLRPVLAGAGLDPLVLFSAHSIPRSMADTSPYEHQLGVAAAAVAEASGVGRFELVYQSRSGPPTQPWLEPDVCDRLRAHTDHSRSVVVCPIGFVSDHMEVLYDLDTEAAEVAGEEGITLLRAPTAGTHPSFVAMIRELYLERVSAVARRAVGADGTWGDDCPLGCCQGPARPLVAAEAGHGANPV